MSYSTAGTVGSGRQARYGLLCSARERSTVQDLPDYFLHAFFQMNLFRIYRGDTLLTMLELMVNWQRIRAGLPDLNCADCLEVSHSPRPSESLYGHLHSLPGAWSTSGP